ncbi:unnamed protein product [Rhizophagus irregularis]|nr:unnamed protein product [Rhizophagus irregularis]
MKKLDKYKIFEGRVLGQYAYEKPGKLPGCCIFKRGTERSLETYYTAVFLINGAVTERYKRTIVELENRIRESEVDVTVKGRMKLEKEGEIKILTGKLRFSGKAETRHEFAGHKWQSELRPNKEKSRKRKNQKNYQNGRFRLNQHPIRFFG